MAEKIDFAKIIEDCDTSIRGGQLDRASKILHGLPLARIPREFRVRIAQLSRRAGLVAQGLRLLTPIVVTDRKQDPATAAELAEYAVLLQRYGGTREALRILSTLDRSQVVESHLYLAFCHFNLWEHDKAVPHLEQYITQAPNDYAAKIGRVNLASALVAVGRFGEAEVILLKLLEEIHPESGVRLIGNCLEMLGQIKILTREFGEARSFLDRASVLFKSRRVFDQLFVAKWSAILEALEMRSTEALTRFRTEALERFEHESVREADFYALQVHFDEASFNYLYFGTPSPAYRAKIAETLGSRPEQNHFVHGYGDEPLCLNTESGELNGREILRPGSLQHQLLEILLRDFYRPISSAELFTELFPQERFNIMSSPHRLHQLQYRLREALESENLPCDLVSENGLISLKITGDIAFRVPRDRKPVDQFSVKIRRLRDVFGGERGFSAAEARQAIDLSEAEFRRFALKALDEGALEKAGAARRTRYFLVG